LAEFGFEDLDDVGNTIMLTHLLNRYFKSQIKGASRQLRSHGIPLTFWRDGRAKDPAFEHLNILVPGQGVSRATKLGTGKLGSVEA
jgi:hypothetical protein